MMPKNSCAIQSTKTPVSKLTGLVCKNRGIWIGFREGNSVQWSSRRTISNQLTHHLTQLHNARTSNHVCHILTTNSGKEWSHSCRLSNVCPDHNTNIIFHIHTEWVMTVEELLFSKSLQDQFLTVRCSHQWLQKFLDLPFLYKMQKGVSTLNRMKRLCVYHC